jgi:hypothetical protein
VDRLKPELLARNMEPRDLCSEYRLQAASTGGPHVTGMLPEEEDGETAKEAVAAAAGSAAPEVCFPLSLILHLVRIM